MPFWLICYPAFNITRIFYFLTYKCGYETCISSLDSLPNELVWCLIMLYISAFFYIFLGIYLYEVIPQQFGVRKSPLFCIQPLIKKLTKKFSKKKKLKTEDLNVKDGKNLKPTFC